MEMDTLVSVIALIVVAVLSLLYFFCKKKDKPESSLPGSGSGGLAAISYNHGTENVEQEDCIEIVLNQNPKGSAVKNITGEGAHRSGKQKNVKTITGAGVSDAVAIEAIRKFGKSSTMENETNAEEAEELDFR